MIPQWTLEELLPHRPPMILIDAVEDFRPEEKSLTARVAVTPEQIFYFDAAEPRSAGVPNWVAIEYMAQTCAALAGCWDRHVAPEQPVRPGLLLGTRKLTLDLDRFEAGRTYHVTAVNAFSDADAASFECAIRDDAGAVVATAVLSAYRPPDLENFLKEQANQ